MNPAPSQRSKAYLLGASTLEMLRRLFIYRITPTAMITAHLFLRRYSEECVASTMRPKYWRWQGGLILLVLVQLSKSVKIGQK